MEKDAEEEQPFVAPCLEGPRVTVFVNGLFNPQRDDVWAPIKERLQHILKCPAVHVHNPTLAVDIPYDEAIETVKKNSALALGATLFAAAAVALDVYNETGVTEKVVATAMDKIKGTLEPKAKKIAAKIETELEAVLAMNPGVNKVFLVSHSHGGWCAREFVELGAAARIVEKFGVDIHLYAMGCPVLVEKGDGIKFLLQIHNAKDPISLRYAQRGAENAPQVSTSNDKAFHSCLKYLELLENFEN